MTGKSKKQLGADSPLYSPETFDPDESVGLLMRRVLHSMKTQIDEAMEPHDLTAMQWQPLYIIANGLATTSAELARRMQMDTGAVTRLVDRMEQKGLVERIRCEADRRVVNLRVTDSGRQSASVIPVAMCAVLNDHLAGFTADEADALKGFLRRMLENGAAEGSAEPASQTSNSTSRTKTNKTGKPS